MTWLLLLLVSYEGRFADDPRLAAIRRDLPAQLARARERVPVEGDVRVALEDLGDRAPGEVARAVRDGDGYRIVLYAEPLLLRAHDPAVTLAHELVHVIQLQRWGARRFRETPPWIVEGMAVYRAGQLAGRARVLAAHVGREPEPADPAVRLVNGLAGRHTLLDYFEDGAAFAAVEERHGRVKADAFVEALLAGRSAPEAAKAVLGETMAVFEEQARAYALRTLRPLLRAGRDRVLRLRAGVEARAYASLEEIPLAGGVYAVDDAYQRALALEGLGKPGAALELLRKRFLDDRVRESTLLVPALRLEERLAKAAGRVVPARPELEPYLGER